MSDEFGIYIQTYPADFHLSSVLVRSIQQVSPDIPIMIIPGDDFDYENHPFNVPIMPAPGSFWSKLGHKDRSFWAFEGPFETFLFIDADIICVKSLDSLAKRAVQQPGDFIFVQPWMDEAEWQATARNPSHPKYQECLELVRSEVGRGPLSEFDPDHDFLARHPFNTGAFVSRRSVIRESDLAELYEAERKFFRDVLQKEWSWPTRDLFFYDQGRMNYLIAKRSIPVFPIEPDLICLTGASTVQVSFENVRNDTYDFHLIHWMGSKSPNPSLFSRGPLFSAYAFLWTAVGERTGRYVAQGYTNLPECTGYSLWRHYHEQIFGPMRLTTRLAWSWRDLKRSSKLFLRWIKFLVQERRRTGPRASTP